MTTWEWNLEGYKSATACEINGGEFGLKMFVKMDREITENDKMAFDRARQAVEESVRKETEALKPETHTRAAVERAELLALFPSPIYVEEIPNGYCSRYCCAFKPWFVVTTSRGRIRIGWRKSVIHLEWTDSAIKGTAAEIFPKEEAWPGYETTQYDKVIHAHG
jgi:hypothetical protein